MSRSDYQFAGPPEALQRLRGRFIGSLFGFLAVGIVTIAIFNSGIRDAEVVWSALLLILGALLFATVRSFRDIATQFPEARDPEYYDQKTLPPLRERHDIKSPARIMVQARRFEGGLNALIGIIPVVVIMLVGFVLHDGMNPWWLIAAVILSVAWIGVLFMLGSVSIGLGEKAYIRVDDRGVRFPLFVLCHHTAKDAKRDGRNHLLVKWKHIVSWTVRAGDSEDPAVYQIVVTRKDKQRTWQIERSLLRGKEHDLLDAVRSIGQVPIILRDSAQY